MQNYILQYKSLKKRQLFFLLFVSISKSANVFENPDYMVWLGYIVCVCSHNNFCGYVVHRYMYLPICFWLLHLPVREVWKSWGNSSKRTDNSRASSLQEMMGTPRVIFQQEPLDGSTTKFLTRLQKNNHAIELAFEKYESIPEILLLHNIIPIKRLL